MEEEVKKNFINKGYYIFDCKQIDKLNEIKKNIFNYSKKILKFESFDQDNFFNYTNKYIKKNNLNNFRLEIFNHLNRNKSLKKNYYQISKKLLHIVVGNELAMQKRVNLSIQLSNDKNSLLPLHSDTWSGDSPFEVVVWTPLVDCYGSKSMYILPQGQSKRVENFFSLRTGASSEDLYQSISDEVQWLEVKYGEVVIFNQALPHGNRVNTENETRWSMNCRFKSVFTPYGDKKLGEFFEPVTLRAVSKTGMDYKLPEIL